MAPNVATDIDSLETTEWLEALAAVAETDGIERAHFLLERLIVVLILEI